MGIKRFFKIKPPEEDTPEMNRDQLNELGIPTKNVRRSKKEKFSAYGRFAKDNANDRFYAPPGYENSGPADSSTLNDLNKSEMDSEAEKDGYLKEPNRSNFDPYARNNVQDRDRIQAPDPYSRGASYGQSSSNPYGQQRSAATEPYAAQQPTAQYGSNSAAPGPTSNPYSSLANDPYSAPSGNSSYGGAPQQRPAANPSGPSNNGRASQQKGAAYPASNNYDSYGTYGSNSQQNANVASDPYNPRGSTSRPNIRSSESSQRFAPNNAPTDDTFDFEGRSSSIPNRGEPDDDEVDLNAAMQDEGDDLNGSMHEGYDGNRYPGQQFQQQQQQKQYEPQQQDGSRGFQTFEELQRENELKQQQEEDEAVDEIKQEIRFTKQSSVASTRNTLKMAQEAEMAGTNTLGMLGHQSEKLNDVERNLDLMKMQNRVADDKVAELKKLNRNILAVHVSNPFTSKRRLREAEDRIRNQRIEDKMMQKQTNGRLLQSTNRIEGAITASGQEVHDSVKQRYQNQAILEKSKRYQFENDEEDDELELEIDKNLDKVGQVSGRLKRLAIAAGGEIDAQQNRVKNIEEDTDNMDIKIHLNTTRLTQIR
ncbi:LANO_0F05094g1_1 [Lachancea nothofagi CBS 11611]|uniref:LANO_0F05094g1_1 n=1 Tax=Lachancea nothofagi CBS 11611 TaxID=1266666 RepID=A0A1G4K7X4_9SACH|nr:LANO_0F05094g1_1 [Lachancea nothofagi CBS 11611]